MEGKDLLKRGALGLFTLTLAEVSLYEIPARAQNAKERDSFAYSECLVDMPPQYSDSRDLFDACDAKVSILPTPVFDAILGKGRY